MEKAFCLYLCRRPKPRLVCSDATAARFELGYVPHLLEASEVQYLQPDNPEMKKDFHGISHQKLGRAECS